MIVLFFVRGNADSDALVKVCYEHYRQLVGGDLPPEANVLRKPNKKPQLDVEGVHFNLSHSHGVCAVAMSDRPVGIDIEKRRKIDPSKFRFLNATDEETFFKQWTAKESYLKFTGEGLSGISGEIPPTVHTEHYEIFDGYTVCVCSDEEQSVVAYELDPASIN